MAPMLKVAYSVLPMVSVLALLMPVKTAKWKNALAAGLLAVCMVALCVESVRRGAGPHLILVCFANLVLAGLLFYVPISLKAGTKKIVDGFQQKTLGLRDNCQVMVSSCRVLEASVSATAKELNHFMSRYVIAKTIVTHPEAEVVFEEIGSFFEKRAGVRSWFYFEKTEEAWGLKAHGPENGFPASFFKQSGAEMDRLAQAEGVAAAVVEAGPEVSLVLCSVERQTGVPAVIGVISDSAHARETGHDLEAYSRLLGMFFKRDYLFECVKERSRTDGLTGLFLRRVFLERLNEEMALSKRYGTPFSVLMMDVDHFKNVNDTWGHQAGDQVLKTIAGILKQCAGNSATLARYGGEEFIALIGLAPRQEVLAIAENIRRSVEAQTIHHEGKEIKVTISIGINPGMLNAKTSQECIERADAALYAAKHEGRNRLKEWTPGPGSP